MSDDERMIQEVLRHLDNETETGSYRMSVSFNELQEEEKKVDHKCCHMYGRPANETVGLLDMYSDMSLKEAPKE